MVIGLKPALETGMHEKRAFGPESNSIIFTSARGGSGCSFLANAVAAYMAAKTTSNIILVDMSPGRIDSRLVFGLDNMKVKDMGDLPESLEALDTQGLRKIVKNMEDSLNIILPSLDLENRSIFKNGNLDVFIESLRDHFDIIILDMPAYLLGQIDLSEIDIADRFVLVTLPDNISANNTRLLIDHIKHYRSSNYIYLAVNKYNIRPSISPTGLSNIIQHPFTTFLPYDRDIENIVNTGGPGSIYRYNLKLVKNISALAKKIYKELGI